MNKSDRRVSFDLGPQRQQRSQVRRMIDITTSFLICIILPVLCGSAIMGSLIPYMHKSSAIKKPRWAMGGFETGLWYALAMACYVVMGIASSIIYQVESSIKRRSLLGLYAAQLLLNLIWLPLVFSLNNLEIALIDSFVLVILVMLCTQGFGNVSKLAGYLMLPYSICTHLLVAYSTHLYVLNRYSDL
ncbi:hypothetical protein L7F22_022508 [Adiantum nelumboides]|nr:hypothetical protein [Adiantum nelumboides]